MRYAKIATLLYLNSESSYFIPTRVTLDLAHTSLPQTAILPPKRVTNFISFHHSNISLSLCASVAKDLCEFYTAPCFSMVQSGFSMDNLLVDELKRWCVQQES